jgi:hypothetical protein
MTFHWSEHALPLHQTLFLQLCYLASTQRSLHAGVPVGTVANGDWKPLKGLLPHCRENIPGSLRSPHIYELNLNLLGYRKNNSRSCGRSWNWAPPVRHTS